MKLESPLAISATSLVSTACIRQWMGTLDYRVDFGDPTVDPVHPDYRGSKIYVFWHENILLPLYLRGHSNIAMLLSRHHDADILARVAAMMGFKDAFHFLRVFKSVHHVPPSRFRQSMHPQWPG